MHSMRSTKTDATHFDYVIVGAGMAGCLLANRLSADGRSTVCLLEAGPVDRHPYLHIPAGFIKILFNPNYTWQFETDPVASAADRKYRIPQGRTLGGTSAINGFVYCRGQPEDYDAWAQAGNAGWGYRDVLPFFRKTERRIGEGDPYYRGRDGLLPITDTDLRHPLCEAFIDSAEDLGIPRNPDYNGGRQEGAGYYQRWIHRGWRISAARAFLDPARKRRNLEIRTGCTATAIMLDNDRATAVRYRNGRSEAVIHARREIVLCAGALNSPRLLQLSGIGRPAALQAAGIQPVRNLPGVGENLSDHYMIRLAARTRNVQTFNEIARGWRLGTQAWRWMWGRPSVMAVSPSLAYAFCRSAKGSQRPDLQLMFTPASYRGSVPGQLDSFPGMTLGFYQLRPTSVGQVRVVSPDPSAPPAIQPNYLSTSEDRDAVVRGVKLVRELLRTGALGKHFDGEVTPGAGVRSDDEILDFASRHGNTGYHPLGTCKMGPRSDPMAVVDDQLRVHGIGSLRVVDASAMPAMVSGNPGATVMMIAERAAEFIRADAHGGPPMAVRRDRAESGL
jgi:choline dehydrogenase